MYMCIRFYVQSWIVKTEDKSYLSVEENSTDSVERKKLPMKEKGGFPNAEKEMPPFDNSVDNQVCFQTSVGYMYTF